jgi:hypothetical protein
LRSFWQDMFVFALVMGAALAVFFCFTGGPPPLKPVYVTPATSRGELEREVQRLAKHNQELILAADRLRRELAECEERSPAGKPAAAPTTPTIPPPQPPVPR